MKILERMRATVRERDLFRPGQALLLALSGGADSTALVHLLSEIRGAWGLALTALHVNHGLRGAESDADERFVRRLCDSLRIPLTVAAAGPLRREKGQSVQMAARSVRYEALARERKRTGADRIVTAHNRDDRAETLLLNLLRGSGVRGLGAIPYRREAIVRPLLDVRRREIESYLERHRFPFRTDRTNLETHYDRNKVRLELIPLAEKALDRSVVDSMARAAAIAAEMESYIEERAAEWIDREALFHEEEVDVPAAKLDALPPALGREVIRSLLRRIAGPLFPVRFEQIERLLHIAAREGRGRVPLPGDREVRREGDLLVAGPTPAGPLPFAVPLPVPGEALLPGGARVVARILPRGEGPGAVGRDLAAGASLDAAALVPPLVVRSRLPGDRLHPLGAPGRRKLHDLLVDRKIARSKRDRLPIVADGAGIVWVRGAAIAHRARVTAETKEILEVAFHPAADDTLG